MSDCTDPSGVPFAELDPALLRARRTSIKWRRFPADVLPLFVAEMDFAIAPEIRATLIERIEASDVGYVLDAAPLAEAFAGFARDRWGWEVPEHRVHLVTDVATGVVEAVRVFRPDATRADRLALATPAYPGFFEMFEELPHEVVEIPLADGRLDLAAIAREFAAGVDVFVLCNPHNPHGTVHTEAELAELARLAAAHDVLVVADEIHAPLAFPGERFAPFAPLAAAAGALAAVTTSASKGWNLAGAKCAVLIGADERADAVLRGLPPEAITRTSILGLHAGATAFSAGRDWIDRAIDRIRANDALLAELVRDRLPGVRYHRPRAGYLAWLDFTGAGLGDDPYRRILDEARVALNNGFHFGAGGRGHVRLNLACAPDTLREAVRRIAAILPAHAAPSDDADDDDAAPSPTAPIPESAR